MAQKVITAVPADLTALFRALSARRAAGSAIPIGLAKRTSITAAVAIRPAFA